ncbi:MAG TPA: ADOP family duplicated permease [Gemmatimonadaceae bacterium]|nr:ADOP family duplicated permease [Gemmatimonadaceae bacterium]
MIRPWTQAARGLARRPAFTLGAIVVLGSGIAATTGVFSVVDAVLLRPLPYPDPRQLVVVLEANSAKSEAAGLLAPGRLEDWNRLNRTFASISGSYAENVTETSGDVPERLSSRRTEPRFFSVFEVRPLLGRAFVPDEELDGGPAAAVISEQLWTRRFQRRADVTQRRLVLKGRSYPIVGVMPADFAPPGTDLWIPAQTSASLLAVRDARFITGVGRMKPGVTVDAAQADLVRVQAELGRQFPATDKGWSAQVTDLASWRVGDVRRPLVFILGSVVLLLLIAVANTAGLTLGQLQRRERELAIRGFLGATRGQVVLGVVQEMLIIATVAVAIAIALDAGLLRVGAAALASLPRGSSVHLDWRALAVASLAGVGAAVACGALPAWRATRAGIAAVVSRAGRGTSADGGSQHVLVAGQIAIATTLLCSTALMLRSYYNLTHEDPGFDASHSVTFHVGAAWDEDRVAVGRMQRALLTELATLPGVTSVGFANFLPASNATLRYRVRLPGVTAPGASADADLLTVGARSVTDGYFAALGARLVAGATCPSFAVVPNSGPKVLVNRRFVTAYGGGQGLVGRTLHWEQDRAGAPSTEIVGVVDDVREDNLRTAAVPYVYSCLGPGNWPDPEYVVRSAGDPRVLIGGVREAVRRVDPTRAVFGLTTLEDVVNASLGETRLQTSLITAFGLSAAALAVVGLYALLALAVATRRREIGIRMALGAAPRRVMLDLAARVAWLLASGVVSGLLITILVQRELRALVVGVAPLDPSTLATAVLGIGVAAAAATALPAWRAARIDPVKEMRNDT